MAYNGGKSAMGSSPPQPQSSSKFIRFIVIAMVIVIGMLTFYCWSLSVNNAELVERVDKYSHDLRDKRTEISMNKNELESYKKKVFVMLSKHSCCDALSALAG